MVPDAIATGFDTLPRVRNQSGVLADPGNPGGEVVEQRGPAEAEPVETAVGGAAAHEQRGAETGAAETGEGATRRSIRPGG